jgi:Zn-dependent protease
MSAEHPHRIESSPASDDSAPAGSAPRLHANAKPKKSGGLGLIAAGLLLALSKAKSLLVLVKALPAGKFLLTTLTMLSMVWFEAMRSGVWFGVGFVLMILIHELGHGYAMKRSGVDAGWPIFIPFFGAMIAMKGLPRDRSVEAEIAYAGPLAGTAAALVAAGLGLATESRLFFALAYTGFFLNLFNLTPVSPLDGGRVAQAFSERAWIIGLLLLAALFFTTGAPMLLVIGLMALPRLLRRQKEDERAPLEPATQRAWAVRYFALAAFLGAGSYFASQLLQKAAS